MTSSPNQAGFSAVELLITLIIASLFIIMGYQLYAVSIENGGDARREASASAFAYKKLRAMSSARSTGAPACPTTPSVWTQTDTTIDSSKAAQTTTITCPFTTLPKVRLAVVKVRYNVSGTEVSHAMFITEN